jgi:hypothetical protein
MEYESGNSTLTPDVCQLFNYDNVVTELPYDSNNFALYCSKKNYELCSLGVLALSEQGQISALYSMFPLAPLQMTPLLTVLFYKWFLLDE